MKLRAAIALHCLVLSSLTLADGNCETPPHPSKLREVTPSEDDHLVSQSRSITVKMPINDVHKLLSQAPIEIIMPSSAEVAGVVRSLPLNSIGAGQPGSRRWLCLADGNSLVAEVLENGGHDSRKILYKIWGMDGDLLSPYAVDYSIAEFFLKKNLQGHTVIKWTYAFKLKDEPKKILKNEVNRQKFWWNFVYKSFTDFMDNSLEVIRHYIESSKQ